MSGVRQSVVGLCSTFLVVKNYYYQENTNTYEAPLNLERSYNTLSYINNVTNVNVCQCPVLGSPSVLSTPTTRTTCQWRPSNIVCCEMINDFKFY